MKKFNKFAATVTAILLSACVLSPAAAEYKINALGTNTVTINNSADNHEYKAYQVFSAVLDKTGENPVFTQIQWGSGVNGDALLADLKNTEEYAECSTAADAAKVLNGASSQQRDEFAQIVSEHLSDVFTSSADNGDNYLISGLDDGYYFIEDSSEITGQDAYTKFILKVTDDTAVLPKSSVPSVVKKVKEDDKYNRDEGYGMGYNDTADYCIGEAVPFKLIGTMPSTLDDYDHYYYKFTDTLGLQFTAPAADEIKILADGTEVAANKYNIHTQVQSGVITVEIEDIKDLKDSSGEKIDITKDSVITVEYSAVLNSSAVIGLPGQENKADLTFSNNPNEEYMPVTDTNKPETPGGTDDNNETPTDKGTTPEDKVIVFTYELDTSKTDGKDRNLKLPGAKFRLKNAEGRFAQVGSDGILTGWNETGTELVSD